MGRRLMVWPAGEAQSEAVLPLGEMFSEQPSTREYGKKLSLETGKMGGRQPGKGVWHPYQFHQSQRQAWMPSAQKAGRWSGGGFGSSHGEATTYWAALRKSGSCLLLFKDPQGRGLIRGPKGRLQIGARPLTINAGRLGISAAHCHVPGQVGGSSPPSLGET